MTQHLMKSDLPSGWYASELLSRPSQRLRPSKTLVVLSSDIERLVRGSDQPDDLQV